VIEAQQHVIAHSHLGDALAHSIYDAGSLVPQNGRERSGVPLVAHDGVGVAHTTGHHLDANLAGTRLVEVKLGHDERLLFLKRDGGSGLQEDLLGMM
jgi:hypothetical protein